MNDRFKEALITAAERVAVWSDLLDAINVFPVADGDTGRNLVITMSPLRQPSPDSADVIRRLLLSARGNSGNIAAQFLSGLLTAGSRKMLAPAVSRGRDNAWRAVHQPTPGTMLSVFDALADHLEADPLGDEDGSLARLLDRLESTVHATHAQLPRLRRAGVIDSGALGMFVFLEGFFSRLYAGATPFRKIPDLFQGRLEVAESFTEAAAPGYCVDTVVRGDLDPEDAARRLSRAGEEVVTISHGDLVKIHLHTRDRQAVRAALSSAGTVLQWAEDDLSRQVAQGRPGGGHSRIHIMTDAAGSITRDDARRLGMTLLDSYVHLGGESLPETRVTPETVYRKMAAGERVSTSQASIFERHQHYQRVCDQYAQTLYLCVGSVFTGNYETVTAWKEDHDTDNRLAVIDTGAASGRLGVLALGVARLADSGAGPQRVVHYAREAASACREYIFLDRLKYLAAGGRLSKSRALFGDMLHVKPVISPTPQGVRKIGSAGSRGRQLAMALDMLDADGAGSGAAFILLEFTDNRDWVETTAFNALCRRFPGAEIRLQPLSLTTGVHTGPGTWAVAIMPSTTRRRSDR